MPDFEVKRIKNFRSLTVTLAIAFMTLSAIVLVISSGLDIYFSLQGQREDIAEHQQLIAQKAANTVSDFFQERFSVMQATVGVTDIVNAPGEEQKLMLEKLFGLEPSFRQLILLDSQGREVVRVSRLSHVTSSQIELDGNVLSVVRDGGTYISSVYIDEVTSEPMVVMAVPETNVFGDLEGVLMAEVNLKFMWDLVGRMDIGRNGLAYVVDKQGDLIAFGDISRVLKGENFIHISEVEEFVKGDELNHKSSAEVSTGILGTQVVANHANLGQPDWAVVVELPVEEAYETVSMELGLSALTMILGFFLAILAGIYLSERITRPIKRLRNAAAEIGKGKLDTKISIKTKDEIGELASAFNMMAADLKDSRDKLEKYSRGLEKKVEERTKELRKSEKRYKNLYETYMKILTKKYYRGGRKKKS